MGNTNGINRNLKLKSHDKNRKTEKVEDEYFYANAKDVNFSVVWPSNAANIFHVLRRQMIRDFRKPLVIVGPKICK